MVDKRYVVKSYKYRWLIDYRIRVSIIGSLNYEWNFG